MVDVQRVLWKEEDDLQVWTGGMLKREDRPVQVYIKKRKTEYSNKRFGKQYGNKCLIILERRLWKNFVTKKKVCVPAFRSLTYQTIDNSTRLECDSGDLLQSKPSSPRLPGSDGARRLRHVVDVLPFPPTQCDSMVSHKSRTKCCTRILRRTPHYHCRTALRALYCVTTYTYIARTGAKT